MYVHQTEDWPRLHWSNEKLTAELGDVRHRQGRLLGQMGALGFTLREEADVQMLTEEVVKSSEIEGEKLDPEVVRSSIARRLGLDAAGLSPSDRNVEGVVEMMLDATKNYDKPVTAERLFAWYSSLFPTGRSGMRRIRVGTWRNDSDGPMQVVSGRSGRERVHFEAPEASRLEQEMATFLEWLNGELQTDPVLKAGQAHLWFVTIHPFDDGNGRIARAIADLCLARSENTAQRFYSMSAQIRKEHNAYYEILEATQKDGTDITPWLSWFLSCLGRAIDGAQVLLGRVLAKARFWETFGNLTLNERQRSVLNRVLDGFEGKLTTTKWSRLTKQSQDTAYRDILDLVNKGVLVRGGEGGRSTNYVLAEPSAHSDDQNVDRKHQARVSTNEG